MRSSQLKLKDKLELAQQQLAEHRSEAAETEKLLRGDVERLKVQVSSLGMAELLIQTINLTLLP